MIAVKGITNTRDERKSYHDRATRVVRNTSSSQELTKNLTFVYMARAASLKHAKNNPKSYVSPPLKNILLDVGVDLPHILTNMLKSQFEINNFTTEKFKESIRQKQLKIVALDALIYERLQEVQRSKEMR
ncbi:hypothetical protein EUX98_g8645 [Antrodiella citrinella]|uniref:Uncharacterized protein n=1 Tax=Antrodiella citrinella TaxID=2447956 RepID=A0A4V3XG53_9APHY|nr:hypothetical protein EUX98_g8645 [Antrodiella citrinella]